MLDNLYSCFTAHIASLVSRHFCSLDCIQQVKGQFAAVLLNVLCWTQIMYTLEHQMHIHMAVPDRNRILFHRVFRVHYQVWHTVISLCILLDLFPGLPHLACLIHKPVSGRTVGASMYYVEYYVHDEHQCTCTFRSVAPTFNYMKFLPTVHSIGTDSLQWPKAEWRAGNKANKLLNIVPVPALLSKGAHPFHKLASLLPSWPVGGRHHCMWSVDTHANLDSHRCWPGCVGCHRWN